MSSASRRTGTDWVPLGRAEVGLGLGGSGDRAYEFGSQRGGLCFCLGTGSSRSPSGSWANGARDTRPGSSFYGMGGAEGGAARSCRCVSSEEDRSAEMIWGRC